MSKIQSEPSLTALILRAKEGSPSDLLAVYERFSPLIKKMARRLPSEARKDAEQELFIELLLAIGRFKRSAERGSTRREAEENRRAPPDHPVQR